MRFIAKMRRNLSVCKSMTLILVFILMWSMTIPSSVYSNESRGSAASSNSGNESDNGIIQEKYFDKNNEISKGLNPDKVIPYSDMASSYLPYAEPSYSGPDPQSSSGNYPSPDMENILDHLGVRDAWSLGYSGDGVKIAVVDTGVDFGHLDLQDAYAIDENPVSPYYGWPIAFDPKSMGEYLKNWQTRGTWYANLTWEGKGPTFDLMHEIYVDGELDFGETEVWGTDTRDFTAGVLSGDKREYDLGKSDSAIKNEPAMEGLYVTRDAESWYIGFPTYLPDLAVSKEYSMGNITIGIFIDVDNETSGSTYSPMQKLINTNTTHSDRIHDVAYSPDYSKIATLSRDKTIKVWWASNGTRLYYLTGHAATPYSLTFSPDGNLLASVDQNEILIWDMNTGILTKSIAISTGSLYDFPRHPRSSTLVFSPNGSWIATSAEGAIRIYNVSTESLFGNINVSVNAIVNSIDFSPNGSFIAAGLDNSTISIYDKSAINTPGPQAAVQYYLDDHTDAVFGVDFHPDGTQLVSSAYDSDKSIKLWNITNPIPLQFSNNSHGTGVYAVEFSPDGTKLASVSKGLSPGPSDLLPLKNSSLIIWNLALEVLYNITPGIGLPLNSVNWSSNGDIVTGGADQAVRIWNSTTGNLSRILVQNKPDYVLFADTWTDLNRELKWAHGLDNATFFRWNGTSGWEGLGELTHDLWKYGVKNGTQDFKDGGGWQFNEIAIPRSIIGDPSGIAIEIVTIDQDTSNLQHAQDTVPSDKAVYPDIHAWPDGDNNDDLREYVSSPVLSSLSSFAYGEIDKYYIDTINITSASGNYHFGLHPAPYLVLKYGSLGLLLVDPNQKYVYEDLYIDFNNNKIFEPTDVKVNMSNPIAVYDFYNSTANNGTEEAPDPDGYPDLTAGMLYWVADGNNSIPYSNKFIARECGGEFIPNLLSCDMSNIASEISKFTDRATPSNGSLVLFMGELGIDPTTKLYHTQGTSIAGIVAGRGVHTNGTVKGIAPNATLIAISNTLESRYLVEGWYFAVEGYDGIVNTGDEAQIAVTTVNYPRLYNKYGTGWDVYSRYADYLSMDRGQGKSTFVIRGGENGFGYGSIASPAGGPGVITVGLATDYNVSGTDNPHYGDVSISSSRGPTITGLPKPDVIAIGNGRIIKPINDNIKDGFEAVSTQPVEKSHIPTASTVGILGLVFEAYYNSQHAVRNITILKTEDQSENIAFIPNPGIVTATLELYKNGSLMLPSSYNFYPSNLTVIFSPDIPPNTWINATYNFTGEFPDATTAKRILMSGSDDMNYDILSQGAGMVNATNSVRIASENQGLSVSPSFWVPGDYRGIAYDSFIRLLHPGDSESIDFELENHGTPTNAEVYSEVIRKTGEYSFFNVTKTELFCSSQAYSMIYWINSSGIFKCNNNLSAPIAKVIPDAQWDSSLWDNAELVKIRAYTNYSDMYKKIGEDDFSREYEYRLTIQDWENGSMGMGYPHENAPFEFNMINEASSTVQFTSNVWEATVRSPASRIKDGLVVYIENVYNKMADLGWWVTVEFYEKINWSWMSINGMDSDIISLNDHEQGQFTATIDVPPDAGIGSYEGAIKIKDLSTSLVTTVPVLINLASKTLNFNFGGNVPGADLYNNSKVYGGYNKIMTTRGTLPTPQPGDWRLYYIDIPDEGMFVNPKGLKLFIELNWTQNKSDIDVYVFAKGAPDKMAKDSSARFGPYPLSVLGNSYERDKPDFNTTTNMSQEVLAVDLKAGLNIIALHNVLLNGSSKPYEELVGRGGWVRHIPELTVNTKYGWGQAEADFISNIEFPEGVSASAVGPAIADREDEVEIKQDYEKWWNFPNWGEWMMRGNISRKIDVENVLIMDIHIWGADDAPDLDLAVFRDEDEDGELSLDEVLDSKCVKFGGTNWDYDADSDADENVVWLNPPNGKYIIKVLGFTIIGSKGHFDMETALTLATGEGYKIVESDQDDMLVHTLPLLPSYKLTLFNLSWNFPGDTEPGEYKGAILLGTFNAKGVITIPVNINYDDTTILPDGTDLGSPNVTDFTVFTTPTGAFQVNYVDKRTTNDRTPQLIASLSDDRGELDASSVKVYLNGEDVTPNAEIIVNYEDPDGRTGPTKFGYWAGAVYFEPTNPLPDGTYTMKYEASDLAGNSDHEEFVFVIDTIAPSLDEADLTPSDGYITAQSSVVISGETDPSAHLEIRETNVSIADNGEFNFPLTLVPGINDITITAVDWFDMDAIGNLIAGNTNSKTRRLIYDVVPPNISSLSNSTGTPTKDEYTIIEGLATDEIRPGYPWYPPRVWVNNIETNVHSDGSFSAPVQLIEAMNTIVLKAQDEAGHTFFIYRNITRDNTKPSMSLDELPLTTGTGTIEVTGYAEDGVTILVNGQYVTSMGGSFSFDVTLSDGQNTIVVEAIDNAGNLEKLVRYVTYDPPETPSYLLYGLLATLAVVIFFMGFLIGRKRSPPEEAPWPEVYPDAAITEAEVKPEELPVEEPVEKPEELPEEKPADETEEKPAETMTTMRFRKAATCPVCDGTLNRDMVLDTCQICGKIYHEDCTTGIESCNSCGSVMAI